MKRIIDGRIYDTNNCTKVAERSFDQMDPVTCQKVTYREILYREIQLKPGESVDTAYVKGTYCYRWNEEKVDCTKGQFLLVSCRSWTENDEASLVPLDDETARRWFECHCPDQVEHYEKFFGPCRTQFSQNGSAGLATSTISALESRISFLEYDVKEAQKRSADKDEAIKARDAQIDELQKKLDRLEAGL